MPSPHLLNKLVMTTVGFSSDKRGSCRGTNRASRRRTFTSLRVAVPKAGSRANLRWVVHSTQAD